MKKNIAVMGAGYWGRNLVRNFSQLGVLKTICDKDPHVLQEMKGTYPEALIRENLEEVLKDDAIAGVVIAAPAAQHHELAAKALQAGKHVFVEKPLSLTYKDGQRLVSLAHEKKRILFVGHVLHYHAAVIKLKEMIRNGSIGRLEYIYSHRLSLGKIRREENILWSFAPHDISLILSLVGEDPDFVDSVGSNFLHAKIPDVTMTNLKFPSGISAHIFVSWLNPFKEQRLVVIGSQGMLVFDDTKAVAEKLILYPHTINWKEGIPVPEKAESIAIDISASWEEPLKAECNAFISAMEKGESPITSGEEGLRVLKILESSQKSIEAKERATHDLPVHDAGVEKTREEPSFFAHQTAIVDEGVSIGKGTKIWHFSHILSGSRLGEKCNIGQNVVIGPDVSVGSGCKVQNNISIYKGVTLEDDVFCGPSMVFTNVYNPRAFISRMDELRPTLVKKGASIGANATIVCGVTIGRYAFIGAGAVVKQDVPDYAMVAGNPAKIKGWVCMCGNRLEIKKKTGKCQACGKVYHASGDKLIQHDSSPLS